MVNKIWLGKYKISDCIYHFPIDSKFIDLKSNQNQIVFTIFRLFSVWFNKIGKKFLTEIRLFLPFSD